MKKYQLSGGHFSLFRDRDHMGDSGPSWEIYDIDKSLDSGKYEWIEDADPGEVRIGCGIRVGSNNARTYSEQDWWQCSGVTEILETSDVDENGKYAWIKFKTGNSIYTAKGD